MLLYRIVHKKYSQTLSASGLPGRWNSKGNKVLYCAESISLAFLENMIRRKGVGFNHDFKIMFIEVPAKTKLTIIIPDDPDEGWRDFDNYSKCQVLGDKWYNENSSLLLKAPSAVLPEAFNYVINTTRKDYNKVKLLEVTDLIPDERIEEILKKYSRK